VSMIIKDCILGKAWETLLAMLAVGKKSWIGFVKNSYSRIIPKRWFFAFGSTVVGNNASTCINSCVLGEDCLTAVGNGSWDNAHTSNPPSRGERLGEEPRTLV
jgi:hypothetical protein